MKTPKFFALKAQPDGSQWQDRCGRRNKEESNCVRRDAKILRVLSGRGNLGDSFQAFHTWLPSFSRTAAERNSPTASNKMDKNSKTGGLLPSAIALNASLNQRLGTSLAPTMLTPSEQELLRQAGREIDERMAKSERLKAFLQRMGQPRTES